MTFLRYPESWLRYVLAPESDKAWLIVDPAWRAAGRREWDAPGRVFASRTANMRLLEAEHSDGSHPAGYSLHDLIQERGGHPSDVLADWVLAHGLRPEIVFEGVGNSDPAGVAATLIHPASIVSNSDAGAHVQTLCAHGDATKLLTTFVRDRGDMSLEQAVWELTGRQSDIFGLGHRGRIHVGAPADLTVFALDELVYAPDQLVNDLPGGAARLRRPWGGFRHTITSGEVVQSGGTLSGARPGRLLTNP
jgi:N-acyl-D-aspartate/D-glutamate deacylase